MKGDSSLDTNRKDMIDGEASSLVYVNGSHEYVIFDPRSNEELHIGKSAHKSIQTEEPGELWFCCIYSNRLLYTCIVHCVNLLFSTAIFAGGKII